MVEHRLGEVLAATVNHAGSRGRLRGDTVSPLEATLPPEITKKQSSRAQQLAAIPWRDIAHINQSSQNDAATTPEEDAPPGATTSRGIPAGPDGMMAARTPTGATGSVMDRHHDERTRLRADRLGLRLVGDGPAPSRGALLHRTRDLARRLRLLLRELDLAELVHHVTEVEAALHRQ